MHYSKIALVILMGFSSVGCGPAYAAGYAKGRLDLKPQSDKLFCELRVSPDGDEYIYCPRSDDESLVIPLRPDIETVVVTETVVEVRTETTTVVETVVQEVGQCQ